MIYVIQWEEEQESPFEQWTKKIGVTKLYPPNLVIGWIASNAKLGVRNFRVIKNPSPYLPYDIPELPDNEIVRSFYS